MGLQFLAWLESNGFARRYSDLFASARVSTDTALSRFDDENAETSQLDSFTTRQCFFHRMEKGIHRLLGFHLRDACFISDAVDDIEFNQSRPPLAVLRGTKC